MKYIDAHSHLLNIAQKELDTALNVRFNSGMLECFVNATSTADWNSIACLVDRYPASIIPFFGIHPWFADDITIADIQSLSKYVCKTRCGIGEIGLDKTRVMVDYSKQIEVFRSQLEVACTYSKPVSVHSVKAQQDCLSILKEFTGLPQFMVHSFYGSTQMVKEVLNLGGYISLSFSIFKMGREKLQKLVDYIPLKSLLLETDSPDQQVFWPNVIAYDDKVSVPLGNSPMNINILYKIIASIKGIDQSEFVDSINKNCHEFIKGI